MSAGTDIFKARLNRTTRTLRAPESLKGMTEDAFSDSLEVLREVGVHLYHMGCTSSSSWDLGQQRHLQEEFERIR
eukprot:5003839-Amphidinium_carterae.1